MYGRRIRILTCKDLTSLPRGHPALAHETAMKSWMSWASWCHLAKTVKDCSNASPVASPEAMHCNSPSPVLRLGPLHLCLVLLRSIPSELPAIESPSQRLFLGSWLYIQISFYLLQVSHFSLSLLSFSSSLCGRATLQTKYSLDPTGKKFGLHPAESITALWYHYGKFFIPFFRASQYLFFL